LYDRDKPVMPLQQPKQSSHTPHTQVASQVASHVASHDELPYDMKIAAINAKIKAHEENKQVPIEKKHEILMALMREARQIMIEERKRITIENRNIDVQHLREMYAIRDYNAETARKIDTYLALSDKELELRLQYVTHNTTNYRKEKGSEQIRTSSVSSNRNKVSGIGTGEMEKIK
jgi:hypothetical protein